MKIINRKTNFKTYNYSIGHKNLEKMESLIYSKMYFNKHFLINTITNINYAHSNPTVFFLALTWI